MSRGELRFDRSAVTVEHATARGRVLRNTGDFTRGSQLIGHQFFMFIAGAKVPFLIWLAIFTVLYWIMLSAVMGESEIQLCAWKAYAAVWGWLDFSPLKPMNLKMPGGFYRMTAMGYILLMPRAIGDDELALFGGEEAIGDVDGDALFAFGGKAIDEEGEIDLLPLRAHPLAVGLKRGQLILEDHLRIVEQASDQRRFAVVDRAAGDEAQQALVLVQIEIGVDVGRDQIVGFVDDIFVEGGGHQKYPSCFFFSMLAA
jgi:hypothetical protein